jgi:Uma2 family endonuclease
VAVIREEENPDPRYADRFYLVAEILSDSDRDIIEGKRDIYRAQPSCLYVLLIAQDRAEILMECRSADGWHSEILGADGELVLPHFGLRCPVRAVYRDTPLG